MLVSFRRRSHFTGVAVGPTQNTILAGTALPVFVAARHHIGRQRGEIFFEIVFVRNARVAVHKQQILVTGLCRQRVSYLRTAQVDVTLQVGDIVFVVQMRVFELIVVLRCIVQQQNLIWNT